MPPPGTTRFLAEQLSSLRIVEPTPFPFRGGSSARNSCRRAPTSAGSRRSSLNSKTSASSTKSRKITMNQVPFAKGMARRAAIVEGMELGQDAGDVESQDRRDGEGFRARLRLALPHIALISATLIYVFVGSLVFAAIEQPYELVRRNFHMSEIRRAEEAIKAYDIDMDPGNETALKLIDHLTKVTFDAFEAGLKPSDLHNNTFHSRWNLASSLFFTTTVLTSIGLAIQAIACSMIPFKINFIWIATVLLILMTSTSAFPLFENFPLINDSAETTTPTVIHHRHRKHHYRHKHRRRSLASKEEAKVRRNKHLLLTKPYWPWP